MKRKHRRQIIGALTAMASLMFLGACATETSTTVAGNNMGDTEMERALVSSGFRVMNASTNGQRNHLTQLPDTQFQQIVEHGTTYYLYADKRDHRLYVGDQYAYRAYLGYVHNKKLRSEGVFVWEVRPADRANNKTVEIWNGGGPFPPWSRNRPNDQSLTGQ